MTRITILGPQRLQPTIAAHAAAAGLPPLPVALITAGWQEREGEDEELRAELPPNAVNLRLYARWEQVLEADPEYFSLHRARQDRLRRLQQLYRVRLASAMASARAMHEATGPDDLVGPEREQALAAVRELDAHHLRRLTEVAQAFEGDVGPGERDAIAAHRAELRGLLDGCSAVVLAGGHVMVLLNRLEIFGLQDLLRGRRIFAWSAGAMALSDRVVLFHDRPPQGRGDAEVLAPGLGLAPGLVVLPHARHRLRLGDRGRVALMARRFAPDACVPLDEGDSLEVDGGTLAPARRLALDGSVETAA